MIEVNAKSVVCSRCGTPYERYKGYFPVSYSPMWKGIGYVPVCRECIDNMYNSYLTQCTTPADAARQVCRCLDLYFNDKVFDTCLKKSTSKSVMSTYISKLTVATYADKSYDDTLKQEGTLWDFVVNKETLANKPVVQPDPKEDIDIPEEVLDFWGPGYNSDMYLELEQRRKYWMSKLPNSSEDGLDIGTEAIIRQICNLEIDINRDRAAGKSIEKSVSALNNLLGSASLKPTQKKSDELDQIIENTPYGVWIKKWEDSRPIPEVDPELQDVDGIVKYISIWFLGHLCKMLGIRNTYCKLYEEEIAKLKIDKPEYEDEDDETVFNDIFGNVTDGS